MLAGDAPRRPALRHAGKKVGVAEVEIGAAHRSGQKRTGQPREAAADHEHHQHGTIFGAVLLTLLVAAVTMAGLPIEFQNIARGVVIALVLVVANAPETWAAAMRRMGTARD
jgi:hypothetical protein